MTTTATAAADWHTLLRRAEPDRVLVCGVCNQPAHAATIYQGIRIVEFCYGTSGDDLVVCNSCAWETYNLWVECGSVEAEDTADIVRWRTLYIRRVNAALKRMGSELRIRRPRRRS